MVEMTAPQVRNGYQVNSIDGSLGVATVQLNPTPNTIQRKSTLNWEEILKYRSDPTVRLARMLLIGPALIAGWTVESEKDADPVWKDFIQKQVLPLHDYIMRQGLLGLSDWGWCPFEKVTGVVRDMRGRSRVAVTKLKHLLQDYTRILIDKNTGAFLGLLNGPPTVPMEKRVRIEVEDCLLLYQNVEGTNWYGESDLITLKPTMDRYDRAIQSSDRYDQKIAGTHWVIYYPVGMTMFNGVMTDNLQIATQLLNRLESNGSIVLPSQIQAYVENLSSIAPEHQAWRIELLSADSSTNTAIIDKLKYYDTLKVRNYGMPERSILEGRYGTKAEADEHGDVATVNVNIRRNDITREVNWHLVNQLLRLNWGEKAENTVWLAPNPINDEILKRNGRLFEKIINNEMFGPEEIARTDIDFIRGQLRIPTLSQSEAADRQRVVKEIFAARGNGVQQQNNNPNFPSTPPAQ